METLLFAGFPLGSLVSLIIAFIKKQWPGVDPYAVWINLALSLVAYGLVFSFAQGYIGEETSSMLVMVFGFISTVLASAGTYDLVSQLKK